MKTFLLSLIMVLGMQVSAQSIRNFSLEDLNGDWRSFDELRGEGLTLVDFWASWCKPCMKAMPKIDHLYHQYNQDGFKVISVNTDGPRSISKVQPLSRTLGLTYPVLSDIDNELMNELEVSLLPTLLLIDKKGRIVYRHEGWASGDEKELEKHLKKYLYEN